MTSTQLQGPVGRAEFDADWYLAANPDVAGAGLDLWQHYAQHGWREGRLPHPVFALQLDSLLWMQAPETALNRLQHLLSHPEMSASERASAGWLLARWHASRGDWAAARPAMALFHAMGAEGRRAVSQIGPFLLTGQIAAHSGSVAEVQHWIDQALAHIGANPNLDLLAMERGWMPEGDPADAGRALSDLYTSRELSPVHIASDAKTRFDGLQGQVWGGQPAEPLPKISVIVPVFDAVETLDTALCSVLAQDWPSLEVLVVDDGSRDGSLALAKQIAQQDERVKLIEARGNLGTYRARNMGLAAATGQFVTVHDADDWSHPAKLRAQVLPLLKHPELQATVSHWVRADNDLHMTRWRMEVDGWAHRNVSSLMFRTELRDRLGYWDRVRFNADTEFYYRLIAVFGQAAILEVHPNVPLAWGRTAETSLTGQAATHASTHVWGLRRDYMEAAHYWHRTALPAEGGLYMPEVPQQRLFRVPPGMAPADPSGPETDFDLLTGSGWFDPAWYLRTYRDVAHPLLGPENHYLFYGWREDRDPGPEFSASGYRTTQTLEAGTPALLHYQSENGARSDQDPPMLPEFAGHPRRFAAIKAFAKRSHLPRQARGHPLICAHAAGKTMFGAERSFLDMVQEQYDRGTPPVVVIPSARDQAYLEALRQISVAVVVMPLAWRQAGRAPDARTVAALRGVIRRHDITRVIVNTSVLDAPLLAARAEGCSSLVHVRELPESDPALCRGLGLTPDEIRAHLLEEADRFIANSPLVAAWLNCPERVEVVPNRVDSCLFDLPFEPAPALRVGLISSNIIKKGIEDVAQVAGLLAARDAPVDIRLIGPPSRELEQVMAHAPANLTAPGYMDGPVEAMAQLDVVLSLSHFAESFGRTVLEAMAAGRPVVCYDRGMPPHLVGRNAEGTAGIVVPADDPVAVAEVLARLASNPSQLQQMSVDARARARHLSRGNKYPRSG